MYWLVRRICLLLVLAVVVSGLVACADGGEDSESDIEVGDTGDPPGSVEAEAQVVGIELFDDSIEIPETIDTNHRSFRLANLGSENHTLAIRGDGVDLQFNEEVDPNNRKVYTLDEGLVAGTYEFYCPIEGHAERGETVEVTVAN